MSKVTLSNGLDVQNPPIYRSSRSAAKKSIWNQISNFFVNFPLPVSEDILVKAVEECAEWKRYVEQDLNELEYISGCSADGSLESSNKNNDNDNDNDNDKDNDNDNDNDTDNNTLSRKQQKELREVIKTHMGKKIWALSGLGQKATECLKNKSFEFLLPQGEGLRQLNTVTNFKLPYDIYCPTIDKERKLVPWKHVLKRNHWLVKKSFQTENQEYSFCHCSNGKCDENCINKSLQNECTGYNCAFNEKDCGNKQFTTLSKDLNENKLYATGYEVIETSKKGAGLLAIRSYNKGSLIVEYTGEIINLDEVEHRLDTVYKDTSNYYFLGLENDLIIDAGQKGSLARFANHSCDPNCEIQKWYFYEEPRIGIFAKRNISANEEITYDYNFEWFENAKPQKCYCESSNCRGYIGRKLDYQKKGLSKFLDTEFVEEKPLYTTTTKVTYEDVDANALPVGEKIIPKRRLKTIMNNHINSTSKPIPSHQKIELNPKITHVESNDKVESQVLKKKKRKIIIISDDELILTNDSSKSGSDFDDNNAQISKSEPNSEKSIRQSRINSDDKDYSTRLKQIDRIDHNERMRVSSPKGPTNKRKKIDTDKRFKVNKSFSEKLNNINKNPIDVPNFSKLKKSKRSIPQFVLRSADQRRSNQEEPVMLDDVKMSTHITGGELVPINNSENYEPCNAEYQQHNYPEYYDEAGNYLDHQTYFNQYEYSAATYYNMKDQESYYTQQGSYKYQLQHHQKPYSQNYQQGYQSISPSLPITLPPNYDYPFSSSSPPASSLSLSQGYLHLHSQYPPKYYTSQQNVRYQHPHSPTLKSPHLHEPQWTHPPSLKSPQLAIEAGPTKLTTDPRKARKNVTK